MSNIYSQMWTTALQALSFQSFSTEEYDLSHKPMYYFTLHLHYTYGQRAISAYIHVPRCPYENQVRLSTYTNPSSSARCSYPGARWNATEQCLDGESDVFVMSVLVVKLQKGNHCELTSRAYLLIQAEWLIYGQLFLAFYTVSISLFKVFNYVPV